MGTLKEQRHFKKKCSIWFSFSSFWGLNYDKQNNLMFPYKNEIAVFIFEWKISTLNCLKVIFFFFAVVIQWLKMASYSLFWPAYHAACAITFKCAVQK